MSGLYIPGEKIEQGSYTDFSLTSAGIETQVNPKVTINSSVNVLQTFTAQFFNATHFSSSYYNNLAIDTATGTYWNKPETVNLVSYTFNRLVDNLWVRPVERNKTICVIEIDKNFAAQTTQVFILAYPNTNIELLETSTPNQNKTTSKYLASYRGKSGDLRDPRTLLFDVDDLANSFQPIATYKHAVNYPSGGTTSNTSTTDITSTYDNLPLNNNYFNKGFVNVSSVYNRYIAASNVMVGLAFSYNSNNTVNIKYYDRGAGINHNPKLVSHFPSDIFTGQPTPLRRYELFLNRMSDLTLPALWAYFPNAY